MGFFKQNAKFLQFLYVQRISGFSIPEQPHFDSDASTRFFLDKLDGCRRYLEYGSGGSTYQAARLGKTMVSIDSDTYFLNAVRRKITAGGFRDDAHQTFIHADIGLTKQWGAPVSTSASLHPRFDHYSDIPAAFAAPESLPDLVLVDGRFRVACALKAFKALSSADSDWTVIVDDYEERPHYKVLEQFGTLERRVGRMAVFNGVQPGKTPQLHDAIRQFAFDPR